MAESSGTERANMLLENTSLALASLQSNKLRTMLTMLGIIIGIAAVIAIVTIGNSMTRSMQEMMASFGVNNIDLYAFSEGEAEEEQTQPFSFKQEWLEDMLEEFPGEIKTVSVDSSIGSATLEHNGKTVNTDVIGVSAGYLVAKDVELIAGKSISSMAYSIGTWDCIVSDLFVELALGVTPEQAVGKSVELNLSGSGLQELHISGVYHFDFDSWVMNYGDRTAKREEVSTEVYIPYRTAQEFMDAPDELSYFTVVATEGTDTTDLAERLMKFFNDKIPDETHYTCESYSMQSMIDENNKSMGQMTLAISLIAGIALLVGGIGVMNIMMVSITERTREIGTRKALGAPNSAIRIQFITEAIILCLIGGVIGIVLGIIFGMIGSKLMGYNGEIAVWSIFFAMGFSMLIGVFFGYYPANKAAKMDPILALSYE